MRAHVSIIISALLAQTSFAVPTPLNDACPSEGICPVEDPQTCRVPDVDFPGLNITALEASSLVQYGPFDILNCSPDKLDNTVKGWLNQMNTLATRARRNAALGDRSRYGFHALFKSHQNVPYVMGIYNNMVQGTIPFTSGCSAGKRPALVCVNNQIAIPQSVRDFCDEGLQAWVGTDAPHAIFMCPAMRNLFDLSDNRVQCPPLVDNKVLNYGNLGNVKGVILVHEFVHMYGHINETLEEAYTIQQAVDMDEHGSLQNGASYGYFAACEF